MTRINASGHRCAGRQIRSSIRQNDHGLFAGARIDLRGAAEIFRKVGGQPKEWRGSRNIQMFGAQANR